MKDFIIWNIIDSLIIHNPKKFFYFSSKEIFNYKSKKFKVIVRDKRSDSSKRLKFEEFVAKHKDEVPDKI